MAVMTRPTRTATRAINSHSLCDPSLALFRMIPLNLAHGDLTRLSDLSGRIIEVFPQQWQTALARQSAESFGSLVPHHRAVLALGVDEDVFECRDSAGVAHLTKNIGEFMLEQRRRVG